MAKPTTQRWTKLLIYVESDDSPGVYGPHNCGMTTKSFSITAQTSDTTVPDCDDPDAPSFVERVVQSLSSGFEGSGVYAEENEQFFSEWALSGLSKSCRIVIDGTMSVYFEGDYIFTNYQLQGNQNDGKMQFSGQFQSDGPVTRVVGSP
jgi:hypothetical protein